MRKYAIVGIFIFAAVVTPPDVVSQVSLAVPLLLLYEISIVLVKLMERDRAKREAAEAAARDAENGDSTDSTGSRSEEHTSELQSLMRISYAVFCLKKKKRSNDKT